MPNLFLYPGRRIKPQRVRLYSDIHFPIYLECDYTFWVARAFGLAEKPNENHTSSLGLATESILDVGYNASHIKTQARRTSTSVKASASGIGRTRTPLVKLLGLVGFRSERLGNAPQQALGLAGLRRRGSENPRALALGRVNSKALHPVIRRS